MKEIKTISFEELLNDWWDTRIPSNEWKKVKEMSWPKLLFTIGVSCPNARREDITIAQGHYKGTVRVAFFKKGTVENV